MVPVPLKPSLKGFEYYLANMWNKCNCAVVWTFFGIAVLWDWNENWPFLVLWPLLSFPNLLGCWLQHFNSIIASSFRIWNSSVWKGIKKRTICLKFPYSFTVYGYMTCKLPLTPDNLLKITVFKKCCKNKPTSILSKIGTVFLKSSLFFSRKIQTLKRMVGHFCFCVEWLAVFNSCLDSWIINIQLGVLNNQIPWLS